MDIVENNLYNFIRPDVTPVWCQGCGLYLMERILSNEMSAIGWNKANATLVSGIGCSGRAAGYFNVDSVHTTHGRAIPVAEGIKLSMPNMNVVVFSGDGDLLGIGGNHFVHAARRNADIKVICNRNEIYGMTGGQLSPTTPEGSLSKTTPAGSEFPPIDTKSILLGNENYYYARTSISDPRHMKDAIIGALNWKGFAYVEVVSFCITNQERYFGHKNVMEMMQSLKNKVDQEEKNSRQDLLYKLEILHS